MKWVRWVEDHAVYAVIMVALAALAGGCSRVFISDISATKLKLAESYGGITGVNLKEVDLVQTVNEETEAAATARSAAGSEIL